MDLFSRIKNKALNALSGAIPPLAIGNIANQASQAVQRLQPQIQNVQRQIQPTVDRITSELNNQNRNTVDLIHQGVNPSQVVPARAIQTDFQPQIQNILNKVPKSNFGFGQVDTGNIINTILNMTTGGAYSPDEQSFIQKKSQPAPLFNPNEIAAGKNLGIQDMLAIGGLTQSPKATAIDDVLKGTNAIKIPNKSKMFVSPEGTVAKTNVAPKTTASISKILGQAEDVNPQMPKPASPPLLEPPKGGLDLATVPKPQPKQPINIPTKKGTLTKLWEDVARSSKGVIERSGEFGKKISQILKVADDEGALTAGTQLEQLRQALKGLGKQEKLTLADVIEGNAQPSSPKQAQAVQVWNSISQDIYNRAKEAGLDIGWIEKYFPRHIIKDPKNPAVRNILNRTSERRYGNLELSRQTDLPYDKDPSVLYSYIEDANKRIAESKLFGKDDQVLYDLANQAGTQGGDTIQINKYLDQILGKNQNGELQQLSGKIRTAQTVLKLNPKTAVTNLTQNISTALRTDVGSVGKAIAKTITNFDEALSNAIKAGEVSPEDARVFDDYAGTGKVVGKWIRLIGMYGTEKFNRIIGVNAGMEYTSKLAQQAKAGSKSAIRELERLGMNVDNADPLMGGRRVSQETQFATKPGELPYGWNTAIGKVMTQFKSFAYKQTGFLKENTVRIASEAKQGNLKPLATALIGYGVAAPLVGEVVNDLNSLIYNKKREDTESMAERYVSNILAATSFGLLDSTGGIFGQYGPGGVIGTILGPTASDVVKAGETVAGATSGDQFEQRKSLRNVVNQIPFGIGKLASNTLIPNSYVDNLDVGGVNLGVNEGLAEKDKKTYLDIKAVDPQKAELFKKQSQSKREGGMLSNVLSTKSSTLPAGATVAQRKEFNKNVDSVLDQGAIPEKSQLKERFFRGKSASSPLLEERMKVYKELGTVLNSEDYTEEQKQAVLEASGASKKDSEYFVRASKDMDVRLQEILPLIKSESNDSKRILELMKMRRMVGGKQVLQDSMATYLYENDYISEEEAKAIKSLEFDEVNNKFYFTKSFLKSGKSKKLTYSQAKSLYKNIKIPTYSELQGSSILKQSVSNGNKILNDIVSKKSN